MRPGTRLWTPHVLITAGRIRVVRNLATAPWPAGSTGNAPMQMPMGAWGWLCERWDTFVHVNESGFIEMTDIRIWKPAVASAIPLVFAWWPDLRRFRRRHLGLCPSCGYDRRGLAADANCPECGKV
jgi:hypothetical protein